ncbi:Uncharacterized protein dnl_34240 [Desulfonema limicola]|uniref:Uncharacterized protein n=1 Tax=Desulfonema limicola TaxID=45656 RepID=A0A975B998_9BACT|nr:hypothetical protein [Desulfonema limicola]QTA81098.1 Uncharacterized protein dnl_34240 [Desulfonema limicola]
MNQEEQKKMEAEILNARRMIVEMIDASIELAAKKGKHSLKTGCSCISCVNKRKTLLRGKEPEWKFRL